MPGIVFLSCGQNDRELAIAEKINSLLEGVGLTVFIARSTNNMRSLNNDVLTNLAYADYVLFVNFRRKAAGFPGSLYAHQELAMALALGHERLLLYSEKGAPKAGVISFMIENRRPFTTADELLDQIREDVAKERWSPTYSRFLRATRLDKRPGLVFGDGAGNLLQGTGIGIVLENQSRDLQDSIIVTLETLDGKTPAYLFCSPLKVSGQRRYDAAIPPGSSVMFDILMEGTCTAGGRIAPGVFLVSALDLAPLPPLFADGGDHKLVFRVDARARQPIRFTLVRKNGEYTLKQERRRRKPRLR
jgi:hypothetical protein